MPSLVCHSKSLGSGHLGGHAQALVPGPAFGSSGVLAKVLSLGGCFEWLCHGYVYEALQCSEHAPDVARLRSCPRSPAKQVLCSKRRRQGGSLQKSKCIACAPCSWMFLHVRDMFLPCMPGDQSVTFNLLGER